MTQVLKLEMSSILLGKEIKIWEEELGDVISSVWY